MPYNPAVSLSIITEEKWKHFPPPDLYVNIYINLFMIVKYWNQAKGPSNILCSKYISKSWYIHIMECYLAIKRNDLLIHETIWNDLKGIMAENTYCMTPFERGSAKG